VVTARRIDHIPIQPDPEAGRVLDGRYVIRGLLGRGAMARVFLAEDGESGEPVAVKVLESLGGARSDTAKQRFFREARAAAMLKHPSIVRILDLGLRDDGVPYLVLEHLFGEVLGELLRRVSVLGAGLGLAIVREAAAGLVAAHAAGIVHRDVKPDNVFLVGAPGEPYGVKLLDFGLAKLDQQSGFTKAGTAVGTMEYMAPEQLLTERPDARTDVYALGVVMYRMFTGRLPFEGKDEAELLARQLIDAAPPPSTIEAQLEPRIEAVILRALCKRPDNRYPTAAALLEDVERLLGKRPGPLFAASPLPLPDAYEPRSLFARHAAKFFYQRLGLPAPAWATAPPED
jgi:serine/threonine protein kinase